MIPPSLRQTVLIQRRYPSNTVDPLGRRLLMRRGLRVRSATVTARELACLVGELGKPTLLGYLACCEQLRSELSYEPLWFIRFRLGRRVRNYQKNVFVALDDLVHPRLDLRSENERLVDTIEKKLKGPPLTFMGVDWASPRPDYTALVQLDGNSVWSTVRYSWED